MTRRNRSKSRQRIWRLLLGTALCLLACALVIKPGVAAGWGGDSIAHIEDEVTLTITNDGFTPAQVTRPAGRFLLSVDNRSDATELTLRLNSEDGTLMREIKKPANTLDWSEEIELAAGHYTLIEAEHPAWVCHITAQ